MQKNVIDLLTVKFQHKQFCKITHVPRPINGYHPTVYASKRTCMNMCTFTRIGARFKIDMAMHCGTCIYMYMYLT